MSVSDVQPDMSILLIDDEADIRQIIGKHLKALGYRLYLAEGGAEGLDILRSENIDVVITDIKMPKTDGFQVLRQTKRISPGTEVVMITGHGDIEAAVQAMREGAFDFFTKPVKLRELRASLERTIRFHTLRQERDRYRERLNHIDTETQKCYGLSAIIGESPAIRKVRALIDHVCLSDTTTVLIQGETGTGKELVARAIHYGSTRAEGPFVAINCTAVPESLVESEFYGHVKGAFTDARDSHKGHFELADGGTVFLDEIGDMNTTMQSSLLRTLEERTIRRVGGSREIPVNVRVISATNRNLPEAISQQAFREDLYYRLNTFTISLPPLREQREDILPLAQHFLDRYTQEMRKPIEGFTPEAAAILEAHRFPGNVRELRNIVERAVILCRGRRVNADDLQFDPFVTPGADPSAGEGKQTTQAGSLGVASDGAVDLAAVFAAIRGDSLNLAEIEKAVVQEALRRCGGKQVRATRLLGISRTSIRTRMDRYNLS